jgi:hypothetical protein
MRDITHKVEFSRELMLQSEQSEPSNGGVATVKWRVKHVLKMDKSNSVKQTHIEFLCGFHGNTIRKNNGHHHNS